ncbi:hypothetical protein [Acinetobacter seifertii]|uniref:hypothetical protein n=1 Tax=Acinetobacter seifertii TaxID=1530123 RepID=UPI003F52344B
MLIEYPKMLYKGDLVNFEYATAETVEHEEELKNNGWVEHHELEQLDDSPEIKESVEEPKEVDLDAFVPVEQFDSLAEKLTETEEQLNAKGIELNKVKEQITTTEAQHAEKVANLESEINSLKEELTSLPAMTGVPQEVYDAVYQEREQLLKENTQLKYSAMGANELMAILDEKGIKYGSRDPKESLVNLALDSQFPTT